MDEQQEEIIKKFLDNVKGKKYDPTGYNARHDGAEGHWLEQLMGILPNGSNSPDLLGYEMKKDTGSKTTFGDWSPNIALWSKKKPYDDIPQLNRDEQFLKFFGKPNEHKGGRYSWSGQPAPNIKAHNLFGQILKVDDDDNILACYSFSKDMRNDKHSIIPQYLQKEDLILAKWLRDSIKIKVERKFNNKGWFKCYKDSAGFYKSIGFGPPLDYSKWIGLVRKGTVFFDSGMYAGNKRPYAQWRANNDYWDDLVEERYGED